MTVIEVTCPHHEPIEATLQDGTDVSLCVCGQRPPEPLTREGVRFFLAHLASGRFIAFDIMDSLIGRRRQVL